MTYSQHLLLFALSAHSTLSSSSSTFSQYPMVIFVISRSHCLLKETHFSFPTQIHPHLIIILHLVMAKHSWFFLFFLVVILCASVRSSDIPHAKKSQDFERREAEREKEELFPSIHRTLIEYFHYRLTEFDSIDPPTTALPSAPITNPVTAPAVNTAPGIVTVPGSNPGGVSPVPTTTTPVINPVNPPAPVSNPVTTPNTNPGGQPTENPVTTPTTNPGGQPTGNPVTTPSVGNAPAGRGQSWCIAKNGASQAALQSALDYACGIGGADCVTIQQGSSCYEPATLQNHASYAFNSYYQKNPISTSCDFGGAAAVTTTNPSTGSCVYPSSSTSSSSPTATMTPTPTPTTPTTQAPYNPATLPSPTTSTPGSTTPGIQSPTSGFSIGNTDPTGLGAFGASPPLMNSASASASASNNVHPFIEVLMISPIILMVLIFV